MPAKLGQHAAIATDTATATEHQQCKIRVLAVNGAARRRRRMWTRAGNTPSAKVLPVSASEFTPTSGNTGGQTDGDAVGLKSRVCLG